MSVVRLNFAWDIFCRVVDNYGDIGVCWRLARQLAAEHNVAVRLWVDDLNSFARLCPEIDSSLDRQRIAGMTVYRWREPFPDAIPGDVVIEAFGCELPAVFQAAMTAKAQPPVWINLEYLSAENWVTGSHALPSPQAKLRKYFFFPGFVAGTGGLLREGDLIVSHGPAQCHLGAAGGGAQIGLIGVRQAGGDERHEVQQIFLSFGIQHAVFTEAPSQGG